ncbi:PH domain-containing protein [Rubritalea sp.]|uniref:PH domain-containing protein n=1 Tax=Rubritalea sp. TaxID=2109375 RepID=UPI003EFA7FC3
MNRYRSAVDWWLGAILIACPLVCFGLGFYFLTFSLSAGTWTIVSAIAVAGIIALFLPCHYTLHDDHLLVRSGILKKKIEYKGIREVELSSCPISAPAMSLKRIRIESDAGSVLISPVNRDEFIGILRERSIQTDLDNA